MHRIAGGVGGVSTATLVALVADESTQPDPLAIPLLAVIAIVAAVVWVLTRSPNGGQSAEGGADAYAAGRDINIATPTPEPQRPLPDPLVAARRELRDNRDKVAEALEEGRYEFRFFLSHSKESRADDALGNDPDLREKLSDAYSGCKRLRRRIKSRGHAGVNGDLVQVVPEDELPELLGAIDDALAGLSQWQG